MQNKAISVPPRLTLVPGGRPLRVVRAGEEADQPVLQMVRPDDSLAPEGESRVRDLRQAIEAGDYHVPPELVAERMLAEWEACRDWQARLLARIVQHP